jgi:hypothetical protein
MSDLSTLVTIVVGALVVLGFVLALSLYTKGRPFASGDVFRASRLSRGNHLFPTQVLIAPTSVVHYTPQWIGKLEHSIHVAHIASVLIDTKLLFSDVLIETTGGVSPIRCYGHRKADAIRMKELIERYQSEYYRTGGAPSTPSPQSVRARG